MKLVLFFLGILFTSLIYSQEVKLGLPVGHKYQKIVFSADNNFLITVGEKTSVIWDVETKKMIAEVNNNDIRNDAVNSLLKYEGCKIKLAHPFLAPDNNEFIPSTLCKGFLLKINGNSLEISNKKGDLIQTINDSINGISGVSINPSGTIVVTGAQKTLAKNDIKLWNIVTGRLLNKFEGHDFSVSSLSFSPCGKFLLSSSEYESKAILWEIKTGKVLHIFKGNQNHPFISSCFSPTGKYVVISIVGESLRIYETKNNLLLYNIKHFEKGKNEDFFNFSFCMNDSLVLTYSYDNLAKLWNVKDGVVIKEFNFTGLLSELTNPSFDDSSNYISFHNLNNTITIDLKNGYTKTNLKYQTRNIVGYNNIYKCDENGQLWSYNDKGYLGTPFYLKNGANIEIFTDPKKKYFMNLSKGLSLWKYETQLQMIKHLSFDNNPNKWVHIHPSGYFDASPEAMELMYWTKGLDIIEFSQLKDRYWLPGLWEKVMNGEELPEVRGMNELKLQPKVEFGELENGNLSIELTKRDGGYGKVSIFINGKEVINDARGNDIDSSKAKLTILYSIKDHPYLINGENEIMVKASSADGFVQGRGKLFKTLVEKNVTKPQFFGVVIGVSKYMNSNINLKYPLNDAKAMFSSLKMGAENLFGEDRTNVYSITSEEDKKPTKENIQQVFDSISKKAKPEDVIVIYLSGHGVTWGGEQGDFYFLTSDATAANKNAYSDPVIRENNTISTSEWVEMLKSIAALKQVMIIDACGSGKAVDNLIASRDVEASQIKAIDRMKDRTGMYIISGCTADAVSYEASQYGQGLLTYSILEAMKGAAIKPDGSVDVNLMMQHARERVPELAEGVGGVQQPQLLAPKGGSFDIGILNELDRKAIPLANPKRVFVRSNLVDSEEFEDLLDLSDLLDEELISISSKGTEGSIVYFDAKKYPNACKISGGYTVEAGVINLSLKIRCGEELEKFELEVESKEELVVEILKLIE